MIAHYSIDKRNSDWTQNIHQPANGDEVLFVVVVFNEVTIRVLRESQIDMPTEEVEDYVPSPPPMELAQPPKASTNYEPASKTSPPQDESDQELDYCQKRTGARALPWV